MRTSPKPVLATSYRFCSRQRVLLPKMRLYEDRIAFNGWTFRGRFTRTVLLNTIERVEWWSGRDDVNLALFLSSGEVIDLVVPGAGKWKYALDERLPGKSVQKARLPDSSQPVHRRTAAA